MVDQSREWEKIGQNRPFCTMGEWTIVAVVFPFPRLVNHCQEWIVPRMAMGSNIYVGPMYEGNDLFLRMVDQSWEREKIGQTRPFCTMHVNFLYYFSLARMKLTPGRSKVGYSHSAEWHLGMSI
eukprot:4372956-Pleurochrysis_carterae.AAC.1